jgi:hypothetical protein
MLRGAIIAVPVANLLAHQFATRVAPHYAAREGVVRFGVEAGIGRDSRNSHSRQRCDK